MYTAKDIHPIPISVDDLMESGKHYVRYGDSCWIIMTGQGPKKRKARKKNSTGADLTLPGLKEMLRGSLSIPMPDVMYGIMPNVQAGWPEETIKDIAPYVKWYHGDLWKDLYVSKSPDAGRFFDWLKTKRVCLVGPEHLSELFVVRPEEHIKVGLDSFLERDSVAAQLEVDKDWFDVVLLSAGLLTQFVVWNFACHAHFQMIDTGAFLDPYVGVKSRLFHRDGRKITLKRRIQTS